ncbi:hypothetical protein OAM67_01190 [bacterium]|nr:hypothetical protein [bacterium]
MSSTQGFGVVACEETKCGYADAQRCLRTHDKNFRFCCVWLDGACKTIDMEQPTQTQEPDHKPPLASELIGKFCAVDTLIHTNHETVVNAAHTSAQSLGTSSTVTITPAGVAHTGPFQATAINASAMQWHAPANTGF